VKHFFWLSDEPLSQESLEWYLKTEKAELSHHHAAWARETGKGVLFYSKRAEDKTTPSGMILLVSNYSSCQDSPINVSQSEAAAVTKIGTTDFSFKVGNATQKFEAANSAERDSWVIAIQKIVEDSKDLKTDVTGRESYKKNLTGYCMCTR